MDTQRLKDSFAEVARNGDQVPLFFYSYIFLKYPDTRDMFPLSMAGQRDRLVAALGRIVSNVDNVDELVPFLQQLGRDHRKFSVLAEHYPAVGDALLTTLAHFLGDAWTDELAADWKAAYDLVSKVMIDAADSVSTDTPAWWDAVVVGHERRALDLAVIQLQTESPVPYLAGQSLAVETSLRPRVWRYYSPANAPRADNMLEMHVRLVDGGVVSAALVQSLRPGDILRLGPPVGHQLTVKPDAREELLLLAGGTGLAPLRALVEQISETSAPPHIDLVVGARTGRDLYDLAALGTLARTYSWLRITPAVSHDLTYSGERGTAVDVALRYGMHRNRTVYVCGSSSMVAGSIERLTDAGVHPQSIRYEDFGSTEEGLP